MNRLRDSQGRFVKKESVGSSKTEQSQKEKETLKVKLENKAVPSQSTPSISSTFFHQFESSYETKCSKTPNPPKRPFMTYFTPWATQVLEEIMEDNQGNAVGGNNGGNNNNAIVQHNRTFEFPIHPPKDNAPMKNIPHSTLLVFRGSIFEDLDMFLFEFCVLCNSYDYQSDAQKLKLFPATLKDATL